MLSGILRQHLRVQFGGAGKVLGGECGVGGREQILLLVRRRDP